MRRWIAMTIGACAACGRFGFESPALDDASSDHDGRLGADAAPDVGTSDGASPASFSLVRWVDMRRNNNSSMTLSLAATTAGNLIVVGVTQETNVNTTVVSVVDNAPGGTNVYANAGMRSVDAACTNTAEIWYAGRSRGGVTSVTVTLSASASFEVWVLEFAGPSSMTPLDVAARADDQPSATMIATPTVTPSSAPAVVVTTAATCGAYSNIRTGNPFIMLSVLNGETTAYHIATTTATTGAEFDSTGGTWNATTAAFR